MKQSFIPTAWTTSEQRAPIEDVLEPLSVPRTLNALAYFNVIDGSLVDIHEHFARVGSPVATAAIREVAQEAFHGTPTFEDLAARQEAAQELAQAAILNQQAQGLNYAEEAA